MSRDKRRLLLMVTGKALCCSLGTESKEIDVVLLVCYSAEEETTFWGYSVHLPQFVKPYSRNLSRISDPQLKSELHVNKLVPPVSFRRVTLQKSDHMEIY